MLNSDFISKYEISRVLGERANQISLGAPTLINYKALKITSALDIAKKELEEGIIPLFVERTFPDGTTVKISPKIDKKGLKLIHNI